MLKETFKELVQKYGADPGTAERLWTEIEKAYSGKGRHYHTLDHLENLLEQLLAVKDRISGWDSVLFTLYYHDAVYNARKSDNEEKSAELAEKRMKELAVPEQVIAATSEQILATKSHGNADNTDANLFTDADLSVLGFEWERYQNYFKQVRKEYSIYPDILYKPGRKKVLAHFLAMERIYKTDDFYGKYEEQARSNMRREAELL